MQFRDEPADIVNLQTFERRLAGAGEQRIEIAPVRRSGVGAQPTLVREMRQILFRETSCRRLARVAHVKPVMAA
jgi:hypothetical protein